jgi:hypothetical protein
MVVACVGCGNSPRTDFNAVEKQVEKSPTEEEKAVAAAISHLREAGRLPHSYTVETHRRTDTQQWDIHVWSQPAAPGSFVVVVVDKDGKVDRIIRGK